METIFLFVILVLVVIVVRLVSKTALQSATIKRQSIALESYESTLIDYQSAILEWIDYSSSLKDRLHGVDSYPIAKIESSQLAFVIDGKSHAKTQPIATHNLAGYALPTNESTPVKGNGNGNGKHSDNDKDSSKADSSKHTDLISKLGKLDSDQTSRAHELIAKWVAKDGKNADSKSEEYLKRLKSALKL